MKLKSNTFKRFLIITIVTISVTVALICYSNWLNSKIVNSKIEYDKFRILKTDSFPFTVYLLF